VEQASFDQGPLEIEVKHQTKKTKINDGLNWAHWIYWNVLGFGSFWDKNCSNVILVFNRFTW
jgi:hypothetical protein